ncbi:MAG: hypothetical protein NT131_04140 [Methanomassiliicoccales archaeon]|nr:hypothetical protein [Methanomassiliicoccales archaeon]
MNDKDLLLFEQIKAQLGAPLSPGLMVMDVPTTQFVKVELVLLKALMEEGRPGLFISVDRPHQYMVHLLTMHGIDCRSLTFVDAVARFSADSKSASVKVGFFRGPRNIDTLPEALKDWSVADGGPGIDLGECGFAVIDNLSTFLTYNSQQAVRSFLNDFISALGGKVTVPLLVDHERNPTLFHMIKDLGGREIALVPEHIPMSSDRARLKISNDNIKGDY